MISLLCDRFSKGVSWGQNDTWQIFKCLWKFVNGVRCLSKRLFQFTPLPKISDKTWLHGALLASMDAISISFFLNFVVVHSRGLWALSSLTSNWTCILSGESMESQPLDHQGISIINISDGLSCAFSWLWLNQFSHSVVSNSFQSHGLQHARLPCLGWIYTSPIQYIDKYTFDKYKYIFLTNTLSVPFLWNGHSHICTFSMEDSFCIEVNSSAMCSPDVFS